MRISDGSSDVCSSDLAEYATSAAHGQTRPKSRSQAPISSRRTVRTRLARRLRRLSGDCAPHNPEPAHFLRSEQTTHAATPLTRAGQQDRPTCTTTFLALLQRLASVRRTEGVVSSKTR